MRHILLTILLFQSISPLDGLLDTGDYLLLMDFTPFATSVEGQSRIALKVPCEVDASPKIRVVTGGTSNLHTLNIKNATIKGTLDGNNNLVFI
jgi:hypothetical protein